MRCRMKKNNNLKFRRRQRVEKLHYALVPVGTCAARRTTEIAGGFPPAMINRSAFSFIKILQRRI